MEVHGVNLLLDQGLPRSATSHLVQRGLRATHVSELGMSRASDADILARAVELSAVVVTLDSDFHALLALTGAQEPSVIRIRIEGLRAEAVADVITSVLETCGDEIERGAMVSVTPDRLGVRGLPLLRGTADGDDESG